MVHLDQAGQFAVVTTTEPVGFHLPADWEDPIPPGVIPLDGSIDLEVCADSLDEFLLRFWIENELWYAINDGAALPELVADYARRLPPVHSQS